MTLDLERIIRFAVVADEQSFTRAAIRLQTDQPWLSRQIRQLEEQLDFLLLNRTTRSVNLTEEGKAFLPYAHELADVAERVRGMAESLKRGRQSQIRIGISPTTFWVEARHQIMEFFTEKHPDADLETVSAQTPKLLTELARRNVEVVIGAPSDGDREFDRLLLHRSAPSMLVPREHALASRDTLSMADMKGCVIGTTLRSTNPAAFDRLYQPFFDAGMSARAVMEGRVAMPFYAHRERFFMLSYRGGKTEYGSALDYVRIRIADAPVNSEMWAYRNRSNNSELGRKFWAIARRHSKQAIQEPGHPIM